MRGYWTAKVTAHCLSIFLAKQTATKEQSQREGLAQLPGCVTKTAEINAVKLKSLCWQGKCRCKAGKINRSPRLQQQMLEFIYILMATALIGTCSHVQALSKFVNILLWPWIFMDLSNSSHLHHKNIISQPLYWRFMVIRIILVYIQEIQNNMLFHWANILGVSIALNNSIVDQKKKLTQFLNTCNSPVLGVGFKCKRIQE